MKTILSVFLLLSSTTAFSATFNCKLKSNPAVTVVGSLSTETATIQIKDEHEILSIRELSPSRVIEMPRSLRVREDKYTFAKFYNDFSAWQDLEISVPKALTSKYFTAFLTVYNDDGDRMVPSEANVLACTVK